MSSTERQAAADFNQAAPQSIIARAGDNEAALSITDLSVTRPDGTLLIKPFSLTLNAGDKLMIAGPSGCGKSTILRAAHGLWPWGSGLIETGNHVKKLIVAQKPHLPLLTLKGIVCFPDFQDQYSDDEVAAAMEKTGLGKFAADMNNKDKDGSYWERLSGGEKQRISFARILLHKPSLLMLDEVTASLDIKAQDELYTALVNDLPDCALISISHRAELARYHNRHAAIDNQTFVLEASPRNSPPVPFAWHLPTGHNP
ncbi:MAG: ATP-binding cassette domain-containing protein [Micavibrio sp.]